MKHNLDTLAVAIQLVNELGDDAATVSKIRLVELIAANNLRAAAFWRDVLKASEELLAQRLEQGALDDAEDDVLEDIDEAGEDTDEARPLSATPAATIH
jgi:hypothetical protein